MNQKSEDIVLNAPIIGLDEGKYRGKWLVINGNTGKIVVVADQLTTASEKAAAKAMEHPVFYRVPTTDTHYVAIK